jgi:hypothetical protein
MVRSCGVDLTSLGDHMRRLTHLADDTNVTKKFLREPVAMTQYEVALQHYSERLKIGVETHLPDNPPPDEDAFPGGRTAIIGLAKEVPQTATAESDSSVGAPADDPAAASP